MASRPEILENSAPRYYGTQELLTKPLATVRGVEYPAWEATVYKTKTASELDTVGCYWKG
jgi:hypothetical protein